MEILSFSQFNRLREGTHSCTDLHRQYQHSIICDIQNNLNFMN